MYKCVLAIVFLSLTAGCTGSNNRMPPMEPPPMTEDEARARYHRILENGNLENISPTVSYGRDSDDLRVLQEAGSCEGPECAEVYSLDEISLQILGRVRGVPRVNETFQDEEQRVRVYGGWMDDSFFAIQTNEYLNPQSEAYGHTVALGYAFGHFPATNPDLGSVNGRWNGLMLGVDAGQWPNRGDALSGDATIIVELEGDSMRADVSFTNITDPLGAARTDMTWEDLDVEAGRFGHDGGVADNLAAAFYGAEHGEVGGTFLRDSIIGAFGGVRE